MPKSRYETWQIKEPKEADSLHKLESRKDYSKCF